MAPEALKARLRSEFDVSLSGYAYELHRQPVFRELASEPLPVAEELCRRHICPPVYPTLTDAQVDQTADALRQTLAALATDAREVV